MCVTRSGYYASLKHNNSEKICKNDLLIIETKLLHKQVRAAYGSRRMAYAMQNNGYKIGRFKMRSLMAQAGVSCRQRRRYRLINTQSKETAPAENILNRGFNVAAPNKVWTSDITYIWTKEGWIYLAVVLDAFSRRVVGWAIDDHMRAELVCNAYSMAYARRKPPAGTIHHSDQGCQYSSASYRRMLCDTGIIISMSRKGNCWDNAITERFFGSLKSECTDQKNYATKAHAKADIVDFIEMFYNSKRLHSFLGYLSPLQFEMSARPA